MSEILRGLNLTIAPAESVIILGRSGAGKSTLLNVLGLLDTPTSGGYELLGRDAIGASAAARDQWRASHIGFVFQDAHVLGHRSVMENLELRLAISGVPRTDRPTLIRESLREVGLSHRGDHAAQLLSGGERQRLAIARATILRPNLILADEPTGNLDSRNSHVVLSLFERQIALGAAVVMITHDERLVEFGDRSFELNSGKLIELNGSGRVAGP